jgi:hypothetical protein
MSTDDDETHSHSHEFDHRVRSLYDSSTDWKDWFSAAEYTNPWENEHSWLDHNPVSLDFAPADYATRHLVQLLQELFHVGQPLTDDRVTTERCNNALELLLKMNEIQGRAARADAILQTMELFDTYHSSTIVDTDPGSSSSRAQQRQLPHKLPLEIPKPNRYTYNTLLQLYARTRGSREIPLRCQELVEKMEWRYRELGELDMKPHAFHWDQVFLAWKECTDWDKAAHAAKIFLQKRAEGLVDVTAYITLLRICGHDHANEKAALLGANVAIKLWQVVMEEENDSNQGMPSGGPTVEDLPSHFYGHFLQAIRCLPAGSMREYYFDACFAAACKNGKVNAVIINEFIVNYNSPKVFDRWLAPYEDLVRGKTITKKKEAAGIIFQHVPAEWKARADLR